MIETEDYAECGGISILLAILPTLAFLVSEVLPYLHKNDTCNGIVQTLMCALKQATTATSQTSYTSPVALEQGEQQSSLEQLPVSEAVV